MKKSNGKTQWPPLYSNENQDPRVQWTNMLALNQHYRISLLVERKRETELMISKKCLCCYSYGNLQHTNLDWPTSKVKISIGWFVKTYLVADTLPILEMSKNVLTCPDLTIGSLQIGMQATTNIAPKSSGAGAGYELLNSLSLNF